MQEREEKEAKKKVEDAEAATIYEQFVASFGGGGADEGKTFLRGGVTGAAAAKGGKPSVPGGAPGGAGSGAGAGAYGPSSAGASGSGPALPAALAG